MGCCTSATTLLATLLLLTEHSALTWTSYSSQPLWGRRWLFSSNQQGFKNHKKFFSIGSAPTQKEIISVLGGKMFFLWELLSNKFNNHLLPTFSQGSVQGTAMSLLDFRVPGSPSSSPQVTSRPSSPQLLNVGTRLDDFMTANPPSQVLPKRT